MDHDCGDAYIFILVFSKASSRKTFRTILVLGKLRVERDAIFGFPFAFGISKLTNNCNVCKVSFGLLSSFKDVNMYFFLTRPYFLSFLVDYLHACSRIHIAAQWYSETRMEISNGLDFISSLRTNGNVVAYIAFGQNLRIADSLDHWKKDHIAFVVFVAFVVITIHSFWSNTV